MCLKSRSHQESLVRLKRGKKETESPSLAQQVEAAESSSSRSLEFALIYPKEKLNENLVEFRWNNILTEMTERAPDVLDFMVTVAIPTLKGNDGRQVMPLCSTYGILMNVRCR